MIFTRLDLQKSTDIHRGHDLLQESRGLIRAWRRGQAGSPFVVLVGEADQTAGQVMDPEGDSEVPREGDRRKSAAQRRRRSLYSTPQMRPAARRRSRAGRPRLPRSAHATPCPPPARPGSLHPNAAQRGSADRPTQLTGSRYIIHSRSSRSASGVPNDGDRTQRRQVGDREIDAANRCPSRHVACHAHREDVVGRLGRRPVPTALRRPQPNSAALGVWSGAMPGTCPNPSSSAATGMTQRPCPPSRPRSAKLGFPVAARRTPPRPWRVLPFAQEHPVVLPSDLDHDSFSRAPWLSAAPSH